MNDNDENRSQEIIDRIDKQMQTIDVIFNSLRIDFAFEQSTDNLELKLNESKVNSDDEKSFISEKFDFEEINIVCEEVEFLRELNNSLNLLLLQKDQQLQDLESELIETNRELIETNRELMSLSNIQSSTHSIFEDTSRQLGIELLELRATSSELAVVSQQLSTELQKNITKNFELQQRSRHLRKNRMT